MHPPFPLGQMLFATFPCLWLLPFTKSQFRRYVKASVLFSLSHYGHADEESVSKVLPSQESQSMSNRLSSANDDGDGHDDRQCALNRHPLFTVLIDFFFFPFQIQKPHRATRLFPGQLWHRRVSFLGPRTRQWHQ